MQMAYYFILVPNDRNWSLHSKSGNFYRLSCQVPCWLTDILMRTPLYFIRTEWFCLSQSEWKHGSCLYWTNQKSETAFSRVSRTFRPITAHPPKATVFSLKVLFWQLCQKVKTFRFLVWIISQENCQRKLNNGWRRNPSLSRFAEIR